MHGGCNSISSFSTHAHFSTHCPNHPQPPILCYIISGVTPTPPLNQSGSNQRDPMIYTYSLDAHIRTASAAAHHLSIIPSPIKRTTEAYCSRPPKPPPSPLPSMHYHCCLYHHQLHIHPASHHTPHTRPSHFKTPHNPPHCFPPFTKPSGCPLSNTHAHLSPTPAAEWGDYCRLITYPTALLHTVPGAPFIST